MKRRGFFGAFAGLLAALAAAVLVSKEAVPAPASLPPADKPLAREMHAMRAEFDGASGYAMTCAVFTEHRRWGE